MAINTQKFLPSAKTTAIAKIGGSNASSSIVGKKSISAGKLMALSQKRNDESVDIVKRSLIDVDSLLRSVLSEDRKTETVKSVRKQQEESQERETKLETPKESKKFNLPKVSLPGMSFLDRIKRFLFFTGLGWLFTRFQEQLPKLTAIVKIITPIYGVVENIFKFILESVVNFIDRGYQTYDKIRSIVKSVGGEKAQQDFDKLSSKLNEYINYVFIGGMALTGAITTFTKNAKNYKPPKPSTSTPPRGPLQRVVRPTQAAAIKASRATIGKQATRQLLRLAKGPLSRLPIVGALVEFGLSWALGDNPGKAAFRGVGTLLLGAVGSLIMPGFGTFIGGYAGAELAGKLYDVLFANKKPGGTVQTQRRGGKIRGYAKGGQVLGSKGRTLTIQKSKKPYVAPQTSQPGKDVGGKNKIRQLYPDPSKKLSVTEWNLSGGVGTYADYEREYERRKNKPNAYKALTDVAEILKDIPYGIGALMGGAVDVALGQKLTRGTLDSVNYGLENLFNSFRAISEKSTQGLYGVQKEISTMQTGGVIGRTSGMGSSEVDPLKIIGVSIKQKVDEALREVQKQISLKKQEKSITPGRGPGAPGSYGAPPRLGPGGLITTVPGIVDQQGRPVRFASTAAAAFILMMEDAKKEKKPFKGSDIASTYRDPELNERVGGAENSPHLYGLAADIHGTTGAWIRSKGKDYGWVPYDYEGTHGGHYEYVGGGKKEKPVKTLPDIFKPETKEQPGQLPKIFEQKSKQKLPSIFQLPGQKPSPSSGGFLTGVHKKAADIIAGYESSSSGGYNAMNRGRGGDSPEGPKKYFGKNLTDMTINEVMSLQSKGSLNAAGRYQFVGNTLPSAMRVAGLKSSDMFSPLSQDKMFAALLRKNGHRPWTGPWGLGKYTKEELKILDEAVKTPIPPYQGGGYIPKQVSKKDISKLKTYPSYSEGGVRIAIQPMIIEKIVPVPIPSGGNKSVTFPVSSGVNNSNMESLSRG